MKTLAVVAALFFLGCTAEWDTVKIPQRNPWTHKMESKYVYVPAYHRLPPPNFTNPRQ